MRKLRNGSNDNFKRVILNLVIVYASASKNYFFYELNRLNLNSIVTEKYVHFCYKS
ncbi:hypothetical protein C0J52_13651 [Blattella germanica]|nr:hypothetical protein C0J52_13651 [Blattella germanica]